MREYRWPTAACVLDVRGRILLDPRCAMEGGGPSSVHAQVRVRRRLVEHVLVARYSKCIIVEVSDAHW